ncbi:ubiquinone/menaquinone biosynthesis methyltransferase [Klebsormidium nitens]|uniref:2-phytyl-1,4-beta-naphthoquinone methyltransferase, chloroplastic n=1 Tax=Klebsormidium nitens TaxID=105231 RepID=A0A0U9HJX3_KLENI|nr:ubiquinone/menaquinone biosynthesis methyltransferase [Klebsormidium nitens]|eukprot:GAQ83677.1 ubiquinone/menaquinone biosynthesis methyltransferase [Klebsormidium nitens]
MAGTSVCFRLTSSAQLHASCQRAGYNEVVGKELPTRVVNVGRRRRVLRIGALEMEQRHRPLSETRKTTRRHLLPPVSASYRDDVSGDASSAAPLTAVDEEERRGSNGRAAYSGVSVESSEEAESQKRQKLFNQIAPMYDQLNDWLSLGQHRIWKRMAVKWSRAAKGDNVLDICCGSGDVAFLLAETVGPEGQVTGLDFSSEQLGVAAARQDASYTASKLRMKWIEGDALSLPFDSNAFDAATMGYGLRNVTDIPRSLREIHRVLKPGASVAILDFNNASGTVIGELQGWLLDNVVVPVARQFQVEEQYEYLRPSIERFPRGREQIRMAKVAGFKKATHYEIANGLMGVLVAQK